MSEMERVIEVANDDGNVGRERNDFQPVVVSVGQHLNPKSL